MGKRKSPLAIYLLSFIALSMACFSLFMLIKNEILIGDIFWIVNEIIFGGIAVFYLKLGEFAEEMPQ